MIASRASRQYRCLHNHAVPSLLSRSVAGHAEFRFRSFIYFNLPLLQQAYKTARPEVCPSPPPAPAGPASGATGAGHGHVPGGSAPVLAAAACRPVPARRRLPRPALAVVAVVAVVRCRRRPSAHCRRHPSRWRHVPRARRRRCCGPLLRRGRPRRWRPPRPRLRRHCRRRNSTAGTCRKHMR